MSVGSLTTTFTPAASCLSSLTNIYAESFGAMYGGPLTRDDCFPAHYEDARTNYYSPGICPDGYTTACSSITPAGEGGAIETVVTCCPSLVFGWESTMGCASRWSQEVSFPTVTMVTSSGTDLVPDSTTSMDQLWGALNAFTSTSSADNNSHSTGLSAGEVAGISIGCVIGVLGLVALAFSIFLLGKRQARRQFAHSDQVVEDTRQRPQQVLEYVPKELPTTSPQVPELPPDHTVAEMPGQYNFEWQGDRL
ncbi:hypothetical protein EDB81DRAFT_897757 [Dactylonectria macrodidyma]|uniref:Uncharacterized protein n=1 Tax=Dactylonectria macrodidyma TaxID=307937 RepID=A0A9P9FVS0_9HYPO|nr:hypothetical protein EDB81DRAFT_897757 [Dactylonectria macrodidyma]